MSNLNDYRPSMSDTTFSKLSDDVTLKIFFLLEDDPRHWARLSCACKKFNSLISTVCCRSKCLSSFPSISADLLSASSSDGWASLLKNVVCCPGLLYAGVLLDNSDFGLGREIGDTEDYLQLQTLIQPETETEDGNDTNSPFDDIQIDNTDKIFNSLISSSSEPTAEADDGTQTRILTNISTTSNYTKVEDGGGDNLLLLSSSSSAKADGSKTRILADINTTSNCTEVVEDDGGNDNSEFGGWSLYDDLYYDTIYDFSETETLMEATTTPVTNLDSEIVVATNDSNDASAAAAAKRRKVSRPQRSHLASGVWNLSREQGSKLLASRFRDDCLYISEWPGCVHIEDKRNYMLFRGVFKNFKRTRVWRTINDGNRSSIDLNCAFCSCKETWDLHSAFCLKRGFGFHDDGEPVVRAYVCENGHVSGAWTDLPLYT